MNIKVIEEKKNPVLKRKELILELVYDAATPSKAELQKFLSEKLNAEINKIEVSKILSHAGMTGGRAWIKIWEEKTVPVYSEVKKETKPKEEKKAEVKKEEAK